MKLSDWAEKQGIAYLTAYRWFKAGKLPVKAYQSESGTIIVQDDPEVLENSMSNTSNNDVMALFLKKTVEFSKNNSTVEDFAAYVLSNFSLKMNSNSEPKYSKNKPKSEEIQKHFQQFLPDKNSIDHLKMVKTLIKDGGTADQTLSFEETKAVLNAASSEEESAALDKIFERTSLISPPLSVTNYDDVAGGVITRSVDLTPQQLNCTGSTNYTFSNNSQAGDIFGETSLNKIYALNQQNATNAIGPVATGAFTPTRKEIESTAKLLSADKPRRGRKSHKKVGQ